MECWLLIKIRNNSLSVTVCDPSICKLGVNWQLHSFQHRVYQILANNQLDALFRVFIYFVSLHVSSITVLIIRKSNCINISSAMISLCKWLLGMPDRLTKQSLTQIIADDVLIQYDLLMMSTMMLETYRETK